MKARMFLRLEVGGVNPGVGLGNGPHKLVRLGVVERPVHEGPNKGGVAGCVCTHHATVNDASKFANAQTERKA